MTRLRLRNRGEDPVWGTDEVGRTVEAGLEALRAESLTPHAGVEELKRRILEENLRTTPRASWAWGVSVAASLLLVAYWVAGSPRSPEHVALIAPPAVTSPSSSGLLQGDEAKVATLVQPNGLAKSKQPSQVPAAVKERSARNAPSAVLALSDASRHGGGAIDLARPNQENIPEEGSVAQARLASQIADSDEEQIVLITGTEDSETGAETAVELETSANVLVGG